MTTNTPPFRSVSFAIGNVMVIDKVNDSFNFFSELFDGLHQKAHLKQTAKLLINNRLDKCVSINRLPELYPKELFNFTGFKEVPNKKAIYRDLQRIGSKKEIILTRYQLLIKRENLIRDKQFVDFSSSYFEGNNAALAALGYSRDHEPGKKQITWGISTGINGIPTALTIQKGNVQDKPHMRVMIKTIETIFPAKTLLIFDTGGNTRENKGMIRERNMHYLTLRPKKKEMYQKYIEEFKQKKKKKRIELNGRVYKCVKVKEEKEVKYVYLCEKLKKEQLALRERKFEKAKKKNESLLRKIIKGKSIGKYISRLGDIIASGSIQKTLDDIVNPFITGLEGYFILESSIDTEPEKILALYKSKDKAEKLIRDMKEGSELRPMRHWTDDAIMGYLLLVFLTNCVLHLTHFLSKDTVVKNGKLLKKYLNNVTLTVIYPRGMIRLTLLSNVSEEVKAILGGFIDRYRDNSIESLV